jgi:ribonuclease G
MSIEIIINATKEETRVALFENKVVTEFHIDRKRDREIVGNIYKGRVVKVLPGMHASFVDIGLQKGAFLYVDDVASHVDDYAKLMEYEGDEKIGHEKEGHRSKRSGSVSIEDLLQEGQEIMVQVSKEPIGTKGPRVTTYISLPGRYLVYMPTIDHIGISRRITGEEERARTVPSSGITTSGALPPYRSTAQATIEKDARSGGIVLGPRSASIRMV